MTVILLYIYEDCYLLFAWPRISQFRALKSKYRTIFWSLETLIDGLIVGSKIAKYSVGQLGRAAKDYPDRPYHRFWWLDICLLAFPNFIKFVHHRPDSEIVKGSVGIRRAVDIGFLATSRDLTYYVQQLQLLANFCLLLPFLDSCCCCCHFLG